MTAMLRNCQEWDIGIHPSDSLEANEGSLFRTDSAYQAFEEIADLEVGVTETINLTNS